MVDPDDLMPLQISFVKFFVIVKSFIVSILISCTLVQNNTFRLSIEKEIVVIRLLKKKTDFCACKLSLQSTEV